jgi:uncharacterized delta-60 repeat protein
MKKKLLLLFVLISQISFSQITGLDISFANNGIFSQDENSELWDNSKIIQNEDGTIYFLKQRTNLSGNQENTLVKINQNGEIDSTFGVNGEVIVNINLAENGLAIKKQSDGKIILCGGIFDTQITRLNQNGTIDTSFGTNGSIVLTNHGTNSTLGSRNLHIQNDKIIVDTDENPKTIFRINNNGTIDSTFGNNGSINSEGEHIFLDNQSNVICLYDISNNQYAIEKYNTNGQIITNYGTNGTLTVTTPVNFDNIMVAHMDNSNNIIFSTDSNTNSLYKINSDGSFNNDFTYNFSDFRVGILSFLQKNNLYYIVGTKIDTSTDEADGFFISAINSNGNTNSSFNFYLDPNPNLKYIEDVIVNDNKIIVSGSYNDGTIGKKVIAKYNTTLLSNSNPKNINDSKLDIENPIYTNLNYSSIEKINNIQIFTIDGRLIKTLFENNSNVSELAKGIYTIRVNFTNGKHNSKKIVKL